MDRKQDGKYDYSGAWTATSVSAFYGRTKLTSISVGIFKWIPTWDGKRLRKTAVVHRVRGPVAAETRIKSEAERICDLLDARDVTDLRNVDEVMGRKTTTVK